MTQLALRPYQVDAIDRTLAASDRGVRRQLGVAATGLGKTIVFASLARRMQCRTLVLAHRDELVSQAVEKIRGQWPEVSIGVVKAGRDEYRADVVVASVQTLARESRRSRLLDEPFGLVIVDEAHHARADTYRTILDALGAGTDGGPLLLGVTATPDRGDGRGLDDVFDEVTWTYDILWGIRSGYLCDVRGRRVTIDTLDLAGLRTRHGDYVEGEVGERLMDAGAPAAIARAWREHAADRQTLVFTPTVETADAVACEMVALGVRAAMVSGKTPLEERRQILRDYAAGAIQVVANCMVLTEGYDDPRTDCIVMARPTKSRALYTQCVGRGTRRHPDKTDLLVLDVVGVSEVHSLITIPSLFGVEGKYREQLETGERGAVEALDEMEEELVRVGRIRAEDVELFHKIRADIAWVTVSAPGEPRRYQRTMGNDRRTGEARPTVVLGQLRVGDDAYTCALRVVGENDRAAWRVLIADVPLETAQAVGEDWIRAQGGLGLVATNAPWRSRPPSDKALAFARKLRCVVPPECTAGELSDLIDAAKARKGYTR